jgi:S-adenosylmethionine:tRNA ribosyltransferase-isomerase
MNALAFELPESLEATAPPETRGIARDAVRLMVASAGDGAIAHHVFSDLPDVLRRGDLLVINVSATLAAALPGRREDGSACRVHFSTRVPRLDGSWRVVEVRSADGSRPARGRVGESINLRGGARLELVAPYASGARLLLGRFRAGGEDTRLEGYLAQHGEPIRYGYVRERWPLDAYQNVYAQVPGSAEMPSAGRPISDRLLTRLAATGVLVAPILLHTGVSSPERHEGPYPEYYAVPAHTARLVDTVRRWGGRVVAVGTTVVRALETVADAAGDGGSLAARSGWTRLRITPERGLRAVDGLITGWHEPEASHLELLEAVAGRPLLERSYSEALSHGYLWHEFGDSHLILAR